MDKQPDEKQFSLKNIEVQMLQAFESAYFGQLSNFLSYLCLERLAYNVTQNTKFRVEKDQLFISEGQPETPEAEVVVPDAQPPAGPGVSVAQDSNAGTVGAK